MPGEYSGWGRALSPYIHKNQNSLSDVYGGKNTSKNVCFINWICHSCNLNFFFFFSILKSRLIILSKKTYACWLHTFTVHIILQIVIDLFRNRFNWEWWIFFLSNQRANKLHIRYYICSNYLQWYTRICIINTKVIHFRRKSQIKYC